MSSFIKVTAQIFFSISLLAAGVAVVEAGGGAGDSDSGGYIGSGTINGVDVDIFSDGFGFTVSAQPGGGDFVPGGDGPTVTVRNPNPCSVSASQTTIEAGNGTTLSWSRPQGYRSAYVDGRAVSGSSAVVYPTETTTYTVDIAAYEGEREGGQWYYYRCSETITVTDPAPVILPTPTMSYSCNSNGTVTLQWGTVSGANNYPVRLQPVGGSETAYDYNSGTSRTVAIAYGQSYDWWVHAISGGDWSTASGYTKQRFSCNHPDTGDICTGPANVCGMTNSGVVRADGICPAVPPSNSLCTVSGCTDPSASNYNPSATIDDGSCSYTAPSVDLRGRVIGTSGWQNSLNISGVDQVELTWSSSNASVCTAVAGTSFATGNRTSGIDPSIGEPAPGATMVYTIRCTNAAGQIAEDSVTVRSDVVPATPYVSLAASVNGGAYSGANRAINTGDMVALRWTATNADACFVYGQPNGFSISPSSLLTGIDSSIVEPPAGSTYIYGVRCVNATNGLQAVASLQITANAGPVAGCTDATATNYNPSATNDDGSCTYDSGGGGTNPAPSVAITTSVNGGNQSSSDPRSIIVGDQVTIHWTSSNAVSCMPLTGSGLQVAGTSGADPTINEPGAGGSAVYTISCANAAGQTAIASVTLVTGCAANQGSQCGVPNSCALYGTIQCNGSCSGTPSESLCGLPSDISLRVDDPAIRRGDTTTLTWNIGTNTSCTLAGPGLATQTITQATATGTTAPITITGQHVYTLTCGAETVQAQVRLLPDIFET